MPDKTIDDISFELGKLHSGQHNICTKFVRLEKKVDHIEANLEKKIDALETKIDQHIGDAGRHYQNGHYESLGRRMKRHGPMIGGGAIGGGIFYYFIMLLVELIKASMGG